MHGTFRGQMTAMALLLSLALSSISARAEDPISDQEKQDIKQLLSITQTEQMIDFLSDLMAKGLFATTPMVSQADMDTLKLQAKKVILAEFNKPGGLFDQAATFYAQHFTDEDIKQLISFYQSDVGKKVIASGPDTAKFMGTVLQSALPSLNQAYKDKIALCTPAKDGQPLTCPE